jgi:hypothetical protein
MRCFRLILRLVLGEVNIVFAYNIAKSNLDRKSRENSPELPMSPLN